MEIKGLPEGEEITAATFFNGRLIVAAGQSLYAVTAMEVRPLPSVLYESAPPLGAGER